jgi:pectate lyase
MTQQTQNATGHLYGNNPMNTKQNNKQTSWQTSGQTSGQIRHTARYQTNKALFAMISMLLSFATMSFGAASDLLSCQQANTLVGHATLGGGTTGGQGGSKVTVTSASALLSAIDAHKDNYDNNSDAALIIEIDGIIDLGAQMVYLQELGNLSIVGKGANSGITNGGILIKRSKNIILRNMKMGTAAEKGDVISMEQGSDGEPNTNIWIDHNEIFAELRLPENSTNKDYFDGLLDGKNALKNVTISYNYFHDSYKASLWGSGDGDEYDRNITFHHNYFYNINSRLPLFRFGRGHVFNNYYHKVLTTGINSRMGAKIRIENNHFEEVKNPIISVDSDEPGFWETSGNYYQNVTWVACTKANCVDAREPGEQNSYEEVASTGSYDPEYSYGVRCVNDVKAHVMANAGAGKIAGCLEQAITMNTSSQAPQCFSDGNPPVSSEEGSSSQEQSSSVVVSSSVETSSDQNPSSSSEIPPIQANIIHNFTTDGMTSDFFAITGSLSDSKGTVNYGGQTLTQCLKMESSTSVAFTAGSAGKLTLIFNSDYSGGVNVDGSTYSATNGVVELDLQPGAHSITKADVANLFLIALEQSGTVEPSSSVETSSSSQTSSDQNPSSSSVVIDPNQPDFSMIGFATMDGGTTGGAGGQVVYPANVQELKQYAEDPTTPYVIIIDKEMNTNIPVQVDVEGRTGGSIASTYGEIIMLGSNKTIVGVEDKAFFNRIGIMIQKKSNIIIRNIRFSMVGVPISKEDENKVLAWRNGAEVVLSDPDCISIQADSAVSSYEEKLLQESRNIWIDHCEFYNEDPNTTSASKDRYDGLLDAKNNTYNVTISWNYFHDHSKGLLIGNSDSDDFDHKFTFSHNYFKNIVSRQPLIRFGYAHLLNNYITGNAEGKGNGTDVRINSDLLIEANHYDALSKAVFGSDGGKAQFVDNKWTWSANKMRIPQNLASEDPSTNYVDAIEAGSFSAPYEYANQKIPVDQVSTIIPMWSGINKIDISEYLENPTKLQMQNTVVALQMTTAPNTLYVTAQAGQVIRLFSANGAVLFNSKASQNGVTQVNAPTGAYFIAVDGISRAVFIP